MLRVLAIKSMELLYKVKANLAEMTLVCAGDSTVLLLKLFCWLFPSSKRNFIRLREEKPEDLGFLLS